jgi:hypothetical protein
MCSRAILTREEKNQMPTIKENLHRAVIEPWGRPRLAMCAVVAAFCIMVILGAALL